jgi:hypothetical protein
MLYYFENLACCFKNKGEWYLDKESGKLYYIPLDGQTAENLVVYAPVVEQLIDINGGLKGEKTRGVTLKNLVFAYTKSDHRPTFEMENEKGEMVEVPTGSDVQAAVSLRGAINFKNATSCSVEDCEIYCVGTYGVRVYGGSDHIEVLNTTMHDCLGGGVNAGGRERDEMESYVSDLVVRNCHLYNLGLKYYGAIGVLVTFGSHCRIEHNEIHDLNYTGVSFGWSWGFADTYSEDNKICFNKIYNIGKGHLSDMGAIYLVGRQKGALVSHNIVHDIKGRDYGAIGLYADEGCYSTRFEDNIVYNVKDCCHVHFGAFNVLRNNIFVATDGYGITVNKAFAYMEFIAQNNVIFLEGESSVYSCWGSSCPYSVAMFSDYNLIYHISGKEPLFAAKEKFGETTMEAGKKQTGWDYHSIIADPLFKDVKNRDFTLDKNSPAFKINFQAIDVSKIGVQK